MTKQEIKQLKKRQSIKINSFQDIIDNINELKLDGYVPDELKYQILKVAKINSKRFVGTDISPIGYENMMYDLIISIIAADCHKKSLMQKD